MSGAIASARVTTAFRLILAIPIAVIAGLLTTSATDWAVESVDPWLAGWAFMLTTGGYTVVPVLLLILVRGKYPRWWLDWNLELSRFEGRLFAYLALLRDEYPSTDDQQAVHLDIDYPDAARDLSRWLPLIKWVLAIPHYVVLMLLVYSKRYRTFFIATLLSSRTPQNPQMMGSAFTGSAIFSERRATRCVSCKRALLSGRKPKPRPGICSHRVSRT